MLFNSMAYAFFLLAAWSVYWLVPARWRLNVLLIASYVFYANWSKSYAGLMFVLTVLNYSFGLALARSTRRRLLLSMPSVKAITARLPPAALGSASRVITAV